MSITKSSRDLFDNDLKYKSPRVNKRSKNDLENEHESDQSVNDSLSRNRLLRNNKEGGSSPLKRTNNNEIPMEESPKKRLRIPNFDSHIKRFNLSNNNKASVSLCMEKEQKKFFSTPKSERKTSATQSRLKQLNDSEAIQRNLSNNWADIIEELEEQTKQLNEYTTKVADRYKLDKDLLLKQIETDAEVLRKRQKQINFGKVTPEYQRYITEILKRKREQFHPKTPNKFRKCSRRKFDGLIKKWRKLLHVWDENPDGLKDFKYSIDEDDKDDFGGCSGISYNIDDYDIIDYNEDDDVDYVEDLDVNDCKKSE